MDAYGHINNVQIVRMLEEARIAAFGPPRGAGLPGIEPHVSLFNDVPDGTLALVVDHKIRYVRTLEYRNVPAVVQVWIGAVKGASFDIHYVLQDPVSREDCVKASSHLAFVDEATGRVQRLHPGTKGPDGPLQALSPCTRPARPIGLDLRLTAKGNPMARNKNRAARKKTTGRRCPLPARRAPSWRRSCRCPCW